MKTVKKDQLKLSFFSREKSLYIAWACFRNVWLCHAVSHLASNCKDTSRAINHINHSICKRKVDVVGLQGSIQHYFWL